LRDDKDRIYATLSAGAIINMNAIDKFIKGVEKLLTYLNEIQKGRIAYIGITEKLVKELGLGEELLGKVIKEGVRRNLSNCLKKIKEGEDTEVYIKTIEGLVRDYNLDEAEIGKELNEAIKEAKLRKFGHYINMIQNGDIHLASKAKEIEEDCGIMSRSLEEAIKQGEYAYLVNNIRQIRRGSPFYLQEETLRNLAKKYGCESDLEEAILEWRRKNDRSLRDNK